MSVEAFLDALVYAREAAIIKKMDVKGNEFIEVSAILYQVKTQIGDAFSTEKLREDLIRIYELGYFQDVQIDVEPFEGGLKIVFIVEEKPLISDIRIRGNKEVSSKEILEKLTVTPNTIFNEAKIKQNLDIILNMYQEEGYYLAQVSYSLKPRPENRVIVTYEIEEGHEVELSEIIIEGNKELSSSDIKDVMQTKDLDSIIRRLFSFLFGYGVLQKDILRLDMDRILSLYYNNGFIDAKVNEPEIVLNEEKTELFIKIRIEEGQQYTVGKINVSGNTVYSDKDIMDVITVTQEEIYNRGQIHDDVNSISDLYSKKGYIFADIIPLTTVHRDSRVIDVNFSIAEGKPYYVGEISITGNSYTREKVIRRQMELYEGELFDASKLRESQRNLKNLGYFEDAAIETKEGAEKETMDIYISVKERGTGALSFGAGYSTAEKLVGTFDISQGNLFGRGQYVKFAMDFGSERQTYDIGFTEPWLLDIPLLAGFNIYYWVRERDTYEWSQKGARLRFGYPLEEIWPDVFLAQNTYLGITYRYEKVDVFNLSADATGLIVAEQGERTASTILLALTRNTVDDKNDPSEGTLASFSTEYAGIGGDDKFVKVIGDVTYHRPLPFKTVLSLHGNLSYASSFTGDDLPIYERFFAGGATTIRGYEERSVGPKDARGEDLGGDKRMVFNIEYKFPIYTPLNLKGVVFFDAGNVYGRDEDFDITSLKTGAGFGLRFFSPFGPLKLDWGYALDPDEGEPSSQWHFMVGSYF